MQKIEMFVNFFLSLSLYLDVNLKRLKRRQNVSFSLIVLSLLYLQMSWIFLEQLWMKMIFLMQVSKTYN